MVIAYTGRRCRPKVRTTATTDGSDTMKTKRPKQYADRPQVHIRVVTESLCGFVMHYRVQRFETLLRQARLLRWMHHWLQGTSHAMIEAEANAAIIHALVHRPVTRGDQDRLVRHILTAMPQPRFSTRATQGRFIKRFVQEQPSIALTVRLHPPYRLSFELRHRFNRTAPARPPLLLAGPHAA